MKYFYYFLIAVGAMELLALVIKGLIIGRSSNPWMGGNGCNLIGGTKRLPCCTNHDLAYKQGGWMLARLIADVKMFRCFLTVGPAGILLAPLAFVAARVFGMWAFQWGKKISVS